jgi:hypothetical protein
MLVAETNISLAMSDNEDDALPFLSTAIFPLRMQKIIGRQRGERVHEANRGVFVAGSYFGQEFMNIVHLFGITEGGL